MILIAWQSRFSSHKVPYYRERIADTEEN